MKKTITILCMLVGLATFSQSNITNILNEECTFSGGCPEFRLGCCIDDYLEDTNGDEVIDENDCFFPVFQEYYVTTDVSFNRGKFVLRNAHIEFRNGTSFITNGAEIEYTCGASITFTGGGGIFQSIEQMNTTLGLPFFEIVNRDNYGLPYELISITGQVVDKGYIDAGTKNLRSTDQLYFLRVKGYETKKIPFKN